MESSIKIDFADNGKGLEPFISVKISNDGSDPRDKLVQAFFEKLGGDSNWLRVEFSDSSTSAKYLQIHPVTFNHLAAEAKEMLSRRTEAGE